MQQVTRTLMTVYWEIGKLIVESQEEHSWGKSTVEQLSKDLQKEFPGKIGLSTRNLWEMRRFYKTYKDFSILQQLVAEIPWGHHLLILQKTYSIEEKQFYLQASVDMRWSRKVLLNQIKANTFERQLQLPKQTNFEQTLPKHLVEQANEAIKSEYNLELLDEQVRLPNENPSIGIILCAEKNNLEVEYALRAIQKPLGVAEYQLSSSVPEELSGQLPTPEQLLEQLKKRLGS